MVSKNRGKRFFRSIQESRKYRNRLTFFILALAGLFFLIFFNFYTSPPHSFESDLKGNLNYFFLINLNFILLVVMVLLILRYLIKLIYDRRKKLIGSRIRTKLVFAFIVTGTLPMVIFYISAKRYFEENLEFRTKGYDSEEIQKTADILENLRNYYSQEIVFYGKKITEKINDSDLSKKETTKILSEIGELYPIDGLILYNKNFKREYSFFSTPDSQAKYENLEPVSEEGMNFFPRQNSYREKNEVQNNQYFHRIFLQIPEQEKVLEVFRKSDILSEEYLSSVRENARFFENMFFFDDLLYTNYSYYLWLLMVIMIFLCVWFSYLVAKSITNPIENLLAGTGKVMEGNLNYRVPKADSSDMDRLINAFNQMSTELQEKNNRIERSRNELLESNQNLEKSNVLFQNVIRNIRSGVLFFDNAGFILGVNNACKKYLNIRHNPCENYNYRSVLDPDFLPLISKMEKKLLMEKVASVSEHLHRPVGNSFYHLHFQLIRLSENSEEFSELLLIVNDLTDLDRSTRSKAWQEIARRIAHEIKNPLTPLQLAAERIKRKIRGDSEESANLRQSMDTIIRQVRLVGSIVNEFSEFAKMPDLKPDYCDINVIVEEIKEFFDLSLPANVTLECSLQPDLPKILLDHGKIRQVLNNLINNSLDSIEDRQGHVRVETGFDSEVNQVFLKVSDNGPGIPANIIEKVFEPYITTKEKGTGLGLAIVEKIIGDLKGTIHATSEPNRETTFLLRFPVTTGFS